MDVRVDDVADGLVRQRANRRQHLIAHLDNARVDDEHAIVTNLHGDVATGANQHVGAPLHRQDVHFGFRIILRGSRCGCLGRLLRTLLRICDLPGTHQGNDSATGKECGRAQPGRRRVAHRIGCAHGFAVFAAGRGNIGNVFTFCAYSGYIVSAPPRVAAGGMPFFAGNSSRNGFSPIR